MLGGIKEMQEIPEVGLEPTLCHHNRILNPTRLPISPLRQGSAAL